MIDTKNKLNIAQMIASNGAGGAEKIFIDLCNELGKRHSVTAYTYNNPFIVNGLNESVRVCIIEQRSRFHFPHYLKLYKSFKEQSFDLIHTHSVKASVIVYYINKVLPFCHVATKHNSRKGKIFNKIKNVTAVSRRVSQSIAHPSKIIHNGINPQIIQKEPKLNSNKPFKLLSIGRLDPIKGFHLLIDSVSKLRIDYRLEIVGDGPQKSALDLQIEDLGLQKKVRLSGFQKNIAQKMSDSDLLIINSFSEGFSIVAIEALYYGNVLISTDVGGSDEILTEAFLFEQNELTEKIKSIYQSYSEYHEKFNIIQRLKRENFLFSKTAEYYELLYQDLLR